MAMIIDTHCHLNDERLLPQANQIVGDFEADGIESAICVGYDIPSSECALELAQKHPKVYAAVGIHPHESRLADGRCYERFAEMSSNDKIVAIGEIGLDYYYDLSPREIQQKVFAEQLELADTLGLPVILHIRDAYEDARRILFDCRKYLNSGLVLHCYSGSAEYVRIFDKLDAYYSFGGAITFKNARHNIESLSTVRLDRLLLETDSPYMTPVPFRGKTNEPKLISYVADKAAQVLGVDVDELIERTTENAKRLFKKLK